MVAFRMNDYIKRLALAQRKHPEMFLVGFNDCAIGHDTWCKALSGGRCDCVPEITVTTKAGKFSVSRKGICRKLGFEAESIPTFFDPREPDQN